jgi:hypothetical protein
LFDPPHQASGASLIGTVFAQFHRTLSRKIAVCVTGHSPEYARGHWLLERFGKNGNHADQARLAIERHFRFLTAVSVPINERCHREVEGFANVIIGDVAIGSGHQLPFDRRQGRTCVVGLPAGALQLDRKSRRPSRSAGRRSIGCWKPDDLLGARADHDGRPNRAVARSEPARRRLSGAELPPRKNVDQFLRKMATDGFQVFGRRAGQQNADPFGNLSEDPYSLKKTPDWVDRSCGSPQGTCPIIACVPARQGVWKALGQGPRSIVTIRQHAGDRVSLARRVLPPVPSRGRYRRGAGWRAGAHLRATEFLAIHKRAGRLPHLSKKPAPSWTLLGNDEARKARSRRRMHRLISLDGSARLR